MKILRELGKVWKIQSKKLWVWVNIEVNDMIQNSDVILLQAIITQVLLVVVKMTTTYTV